jgi:hypothetical protein
MGRATVLQAEIVKDNILSAIRGSDRLMSYVPADYEGAIELTLGLVSPYAVQAVRWAAGILISSQKHGVMFGELGGEEFLMPKKGAHEDMAPGRVWKMLGVSMSEPTL